MSDVPEWSLSLSRAQRQRRQRKQLKQGQVAIHIPLLINLWPDAMNEIVSHLDNFDLLALSHTSYYMKRYCGFEIKRRREQKRFLKTQKEVLKSLKSCPIYCWCRDDDYNQEYQRVRAKCECGGCERDAKDYDPDCPGKDAHNWKIQTKEEEKKVQLEIALYALFYPKRKDSIW